MIIAKLMIKAPSESVLDIEIAYTHIWVQAANIMPTAHIEMSCLAFNLTR